MMLVVVLLAGMLMKQEMIPIIKKKETKNTC